MNNNDTPRSSPLRSLRVWAACLGFWFGVVVLVYGTGSAQVIVDGRAVPMASWQMLRSMALNFGPFVVGTVIVMHVAPRFAGMRGRAFWQRGLLLVLGLAIAHSCVTAWAFDPTSIVRQVGMGAVMYGFHYCAILGVGVTIHQRRQAEERRRELLATQLRALRTQLQPHFLFNTLHAIGTTAPRDGKAAAQMTTLLGDLLRQTLRERDGDLVSLAEERELLQPYLQLQQLRFADRLRVELDVPPELLGAALPDLLLQPLVENALQHGIERRAGAGTVRITARRDGDQLSIDVHDDGVGLPENAPEPELGTGLGTTQRRLRALYGERASLTLRANERGGTTASLRLPFRWVSDAA